MKPRIEKKQQTDGPSASSSEHIYPILVTLVFNRAIIGVIGTTICASIVAFVLRGHVSQMALVAWFSSIMTAAFVRLFCIRKFQRTDPQQRDSRFWGRILVILIVISGTLWGSCAVFIFPIASATHQAFIAIVVAGMVAGATSIYPALMSAFLAFSIPALVPIILRFFLLGDALHIGLGAMTVLFAFLTSFAARYTNNSIKELVLLKETFSEQLAARTAELQKINEQLHMEIDVRQQTANKLRERQARFRTLADNIAQFAWMADPNGMIFWYNKRWYDYTGKTLAEMAGEGWKKVQHPDHLERVARSLQHSWDTGEPWEDTMPLRGKDGSYRWFLSRALPIFENGRIVRWFGTNTDITEHLRAEERIKKSLKEKEMLLQEIHHRVKNNMQVIISLMHLQSAKIKNDYLKVQFKEAGSRVTTMALIHDILYRSDSLSEIDLNDYFRSLAISLSGMYNASGIRIQISADEIHLDMDRAISCGLIINELVSNALKYAFPDDRSGEIRIEAAIESPDTMVLVVLDNGVGLPEHIKIGSTKTLGLKLVLGLAENQLGGKLEISRAPGTCCKVKFPLNID